MAKPKKGARRNDFLMGGMQRRALAQLGGYLSHNAIACAPADDSDYKNLMDSVSKAMIAMYVAGVCDALDTEDGKALAALAVGG
jgi:hypothetical protein